MSGVNKVILVGNVGKDPDIRYLDNGTVKAQFPLATTEIFRDRDGNRMEQTEWHSVVLWGGLAKLAENYIRKGKQLFVEGRLRTRSWDDKEGNRRYATEIIADNITLLGGLQRKDDQAGGYTQTNPGTTDATPPQNDANTGYGTFTNNPAEPSDDLPF